MANDQPSRGVQLRKHPRLSVSFPLTFVVDGDSVTKDGGALDIGGGGMSFESADSLAARSLLILCFGLRPGLNLQVRGRTISCSSDAAKNVHRYRLVAYVNDSWRALLMSSI